MNTVTIVKRCFVCNLSTPIEVNKDKYDRWQAGELIQNVFPEMPADYREMLISGTHPECWDEMFGEELV